MELAIVPAAHTARQGASDAHLVDHPERNKGMFRHLPKRGVHYALLIAFGLALYLPNLGGPSLWDIDEGNNLSCAREMLAADNWHVPTFNYQLRVDKPALLYWLQIFASLSFGVGEFAGRLPSALASLLTVLATYELGRRAFGAWAGLLGGVALATAVSFTAAAHFANPDAVLCACTVLTFVFFWCGLQHSGRIWFVPVNVCMALAVLAKGPVGIILPSAVIGLYLLRSGKLRLLRDWRVLLGFGVFLLVALPWYIWVAVDTKFEFIRGFVGAHNVGRALRPMEGHGGPVYYYLIVVALGFTPWSVFLLPTCVQSWRDRRRARQEPSNPVQSATGILAVLRPMLRASLWPLESIPMRPRPITPARFSGAGSRFTCWPSRWPRRNCRTMSCRFTRPLPC